MSSKVLSSLDGMLSILASGRLLRNKDERLSCDVDRDGPFGVELNS